VSELQTPRKLLTSLLILFLFLLIPIAYSQGSISLTVSTDKAQYFQGDAVTISGKVLDSQNNPVADASVSIQVSDPPAYSKLVFSDNSGTYVDSFTIPPTLSPGQVTVYATASKGSSTAPPAQTQFTILQQAGSTTSTSQPSSKCFIATATYGSEISPEVALLRHFRDAEVLQTSAGGGFMLAFNAFYYSFSPQVALVISSHEALRAAMRFILYPLVGILYLSNSLFQALTFSGELAVTLAGIFASFAIGAVYFGPLLMLGRKIRTNRGSWSNVRWWVLGSCVASIVGIVVGEVGASAMFLAAATVAVVLSFVALGALSIVQIVVLLQSRRTPGL
jgi:hypothetical protein